MESIIRVKSMVLKIPRFLIYLCLFSTLFGCAFPGSWRGPSSELDLYPEGERTKGCYILARPLVLGVNQLEKDLYRPTNLASRGLLDLQDYHELAENPDARRIVQRPGITEEEEELGVTILAMIKKKYPHLPNEQLGERYKVLLSFCGGR